MTPSVVIAVVSWNTCDLLDRCLASMRREADSGRSEVWVVDNGSSDGSVEMVAERHPWARLLIPGENIGFGRAVNEVAARTESEWIVPANADIELQEGTIDALLRAGRRADVGSVAPRLLTPEGGSQHSVHPFPTIALAAFVAAGIYRIPAVGSRLAIEGYWDPAKARFVDWALGAFLLVRRAAFDEIGGFDPEQWMYAEDIDLHWRMAERGWRARYEPSAQVSHAVSAATEKAFGSARAERHLMATYAW